MSAQNSDIPPAGRARLSSSRSNSRRPNVTYYDNAFSAPSIWRNISDADCPFCALDLIVRLMPVASVPGDYVLIIQCTHCKRPDLELAAKLGIPTDQVRGRRYKERKLSRSELNWKPGPGPEPEPPSPDELVALAGRIRMVPCLSCRRGFVNGDVRRGRLVYDCSVCDRPVLAEKCL